jgi:hypothetical protein
LPFEIDWTVEDEYWQQAKVFAAQAPAHWALDQSGELLDYLLPGSIRFRQNGQPLPALPVHDLSWVDFAAQHFGNRLREFAGDETHLAQEYSLWVAEFAWQLANALNVEKFETAPDGADAWYHMFDEPLSIRFHKTGGTIAILSDQLVDHGWMILVPQNEFFRGARRFLGSFAAALGDNIPALLGWRTFAPLLPYLDEAGGGKVRGRR